MALRELGGNFDYGDVCLWPSLCKNSTRYNRTRNFGLYGHAESKKAQKFVFRSALRPNQISFSHDQGPSPTSGNVQLASAIRRTADVSLKRQNRR